MTADTDPDVAAEQAEANARLEGIELEDDERSLIARRRRGEITQAEFVEQARQLAIAKSTGDG